MLIWQCDGLGGPADEGYDDVSSVALGAGGALYASLLFTGPVALAGRTFASAGGSDALVWALDPVNGAPKGR